MASVLLPRRLRYPIQVIYAFARQADDFADEGDDPPEERLRKLQHFKHQLTLLEQGHDSEQPLFRDLGEVIRQYQLPYALFHDLLDAFMQDVTKVRYANFGEVMHYCRRSANPIGRLLLHLYGRTDSREFAQADAICAALQIINFLQDIAIDFAKGRIYLPQDELAQYGISEQQIGQGNASGLWWPFMKFQIERARKMLQAGAPLGKALPGRIGLELRLIVMGGERILYKLHQTQGNVFQHRPVLKALDWPTMFYRALRAK